MPLFVNDCTNFSMSTQMKTKWILLSNVIVDIKWQRLCPLHLADSWNVHEYAAENIPNFDDVSALEKV